MQKDKTIRERLFSKVDKTNGCWLWTGAKARRDYGVIQYNGKLGMAHRVVYELLVGPIPDGLQLDHLCKVTNCVNPDHLEPVTQLENMARGDSLVNKNRNKTHCPRGHEYTQENTRVIRGSRNCIPCIKYFGSKKRGAVHAAEA